MPCLARWWSWTRLGLGNLKLEPKPGSLSRFNGLKKDIQFLGIEYHRRCIALDAE